MAITLTLALKQNERALTKHPGYHVVLVACLRERVTEKLLRNQELTIEPGYVAWMWTISFKTNSVQIGSLLLATMAKLFFA